MQRSPIHQTMLVVAPGHPKHGEIVSLPSGYGYVIDEEDDGVHYLQVQVAGIVDENRVLWKVALLRNAAAELGDAIPLFLALSREERESIVLLAEAN